MRWRCPIEPDCEDDEAVECTPVTQGPKTPGIWNPLVDFTDVQEDEQQLNNVRWSRMGRRM